ncbi:unnamed protein product [Symbiodinium natans]|uniref:Uncharacterized protein n=1 Tax=Symbiodinium natans TaxID=878477 RepID=A0A812UNA3_9DINO|nr:unnamed protein product [Symbiodinium natans]
MARQRTTPFWVYVLPAMGFFLGLYGLLQVALLQDGSEEGSESLGLERPLPEAATVCLGFVVLFAAVDAGGTLQHFFGGSPLEVALSLPVFQLQLLGLDRLAGRLRGGSRRLGSSLAEVLCSGPIALLSVEVLCYAIRGHLSQNFLLTRRGQLEDGAGIRLPATSDGLVLLAVAMLFPVAAAWEELPSTLRHASAIAAAWAGLRGCRWIAKSWGWLPRVDSFRPELCFAMGASVFALLVAWLLERRVRETRSARLSSTASLANGAIGLSLGLLWAARLERAAAKVVPLAPWGLLLCFLLALLLLWLVAVHSPEPTLPDLLLRDPSYAPTGNDSPKSKTTMGSLRQGLRLYRAMGAGPALCPPSVLAPKGRGSYPDPHDPGDLAQPGPRLCLEEPGPTLIIPLE